MRGAFHRDQTGTGRDKKPCLPSRHEKNAEAGEILKKYEDPQKICKIDLDELISYWHGKLSHFQVKTPSAEFNTMINTWNAYNCFL